MDPNNDVRLLQERMDVLERHNHFLGDLVNQQAEQIRALAISVGMMEQKVVEWEGEP